MAIATTAALVGLGIAGGTKLAGSIIGSKAAKGAAETQSNTAAEVANLAQNSAATAAAGVDEAAKTAANSAYETAGQVDQTLAGIPDEVKAYLGQYLDLGKVGAEGIKGLLAPGGDLNAKFKFDPANIENTPGYQFTFSQGMEAIKRAASAQGKSLGGGTLKSLALYGQDAAKTVYDAEFRRDLDTFNANQRGTQLKLSGLLDATRMGQSAATDVGNTIEATRVAQASNRTNAARYGQEVGRDAARYRGNTSLDAARIAADAMSSGAAARAAGQVGSANAWSAGLSGIGEDVAGYMSYRDLLRPRVAAATPATIPSYADLGVPSYKVAAPTVNWAPGSEYFE